MTIALGQINMLIKIFSIENWEDALSVIRLMKGMGTIIKVGEPFAKGLLVVLTTTYGIILSTSWAVVAGFAVGATITGIIVALTVINVI